MSAVLIHTHVRPDQVEEVHRRADREIVPYLKQQRGFQRQVALLDPASGEHLVLTFWESEADFAAWRDSAIRRQW